MSNRNSDHSHVFLGAGHARSERKTWTVIALCSVMMAVEIIGGSVFGSVALVADGLHMSTHAGALLIAALAYTYARRHATDSRFTFGTGKLGDLAGFTSAIVLAMIALLIGYESVSRLISPVGIDFNQAIPIAVVGLLVNVASAWLLSSGDAAGHSHGHGHGGHASAPEDEVRRIEIEHGALLLEVFEDGVPPRFRLRSEDDLAPTPDQMGWAVTIETVRPDQSRQLFGFTPREGYLESLDEIAEPHEFLALVRLSRGDEVRVHEVVFVEHDHSHAHGDAHAKAHQDNNMRAALVHVMADAAVSVLVIGGLLLARYFGWLWIDPLVGIVGALVIANWAYGLLRDTGGVLLDMNADSDMAEKVRRTIEIDGDRLADIHLWRIGPGHLSAILSVVTSELRTPAFYRERLGGFRSLSHLTIEVIPG